MNRDRLRVVNLDRLVKTIGSAAEVARRANTDPNYLSQVLTGCKTKKGNQRTIGNSVADKIEDGCGVYRGWLDTDHDRQVGITTLAPDEITLVNLWRLADPQLRRYLMLLAETARK